MQMELNVKNSPIKMDDPRIKAIEKTRKLFFEFLEKHGTEYELTDSELEELKSTVNNYYFYKKFQTTLEFKFKPFVDYLDELIKHTMHDFNDTDSRKASSNLFYLKNSKKLLTHEQY